jgi:VRR-NUC domain-containing protein
MKRQRRTGIAQPPLSGREFRRLADGVLSEAEWQKQIEDALDLFGWWYMHIPSNVIVCFFCHKKNFRGIAKGFPDLLAIRPPHILWLECKTELGQLKPEQRRVGAMLEACGQKWVHARPRDRERVLELIAHPEAA